MGGARRRRFGLATVAPGGGAAGSAGGPGKDPARALLGDLADALAAYEALAARGLDGEAAQTAELVWLDRTGSSARAVAWSGLDALVVAATVDGGKALEALVEAGRRAGCPVSAVAALPAREDAPGADGLGRALVAGSPFRGAVVVCHAELAGRLLATPRLGRWRRPVSEAIDRLVAAIRMGAPVACGFEVAEPDRLWLALQRAMGHGKAADAGAEA